MSDQQTGWHLVKTYYRSLTPDGRVWCESKDPQEVLQQLHPDETLTFKRMDVYEVTDGWKEWDWATPAPDWHNYARWRSLVIDLLNGRNRSIRWPGAAHEDDQ